MKRSNEPKRPVPVADIPFGVWFIDADDCHLEHPPAIVALESPLGKTLYYVESDFELINADDFSPTMGIVIDGLTISGRV